MRKLLVCVVALLSLVACDNKHSVNGRHDTSADAASTEAPKLPPEIAALIVPGPDAVWADFPFGGGGCPTHPDDFTPVGLYLKADAAPWPQMSTTDFIVTDHPQAGLDPSLAASFRDKAMSDLIARQFVVQQKQYDLYYCNQIVSASLGSDFSQYTDQSSKVTRGLIRIGYLVSNSVVGVSSFQKARPQGYVTEHRKFRLLAQLDENPRFGAQHYDLERDVVIYFDPENRVWQIDPYDQTSWMLAR
ncbi:MAG: hypothetical protein ACTHPD_17570 [Rhizomicrobium sp.]